MPCVPRQSSCRQLSTRKHEGLGAVLTWVSVLAVLFTGSVTANYLLNLSEPLFSHLMYWVQRIVKLSLQIFTLSLCNNICCSTDYWWPSHYFSSQRLVWRCLEVQIFFFKYGWNIVCLLPPISPQAIEEFSRGYVTYDGIITLTLEWVLAYTWVLAFSQF